MNNTINIDADLSEDLKKISNYNGNSLREQIIEFLLDKYPELSDYEYEELDDVKVYSKRGSYVLFLPDKIYQILEEISDRKGSEIYDMINDDIENYINSNSDIIESYNEEEYQEEYEKNEEDIEDQEDYDFDEEYDNLYDDDYDDNYDDIDDRY